MKIAALHFTKAVTLGPALVAAGFQLIIITDALPEGCDPPWLFLQITLEDLPKEWN
jgi:hypothetical protein